MNAEEKSKTEATTIGLQMVSQIGANSELVEITLPYPEVILEDRGL